MLAALLAASTRRWPVLALVVVADALGEGISGGLKALIGRDRPSVELTAPKALVHPPHSGSFPSGHATTSFACATILARCFPRGAVAFYVLAAAIAFSRVYVGVHWPLDVIAGALLGVAIALLLLAAVRLRSSRARRAG